MNDGKQIRCEVQSIVYHYGKIGALIDDADDAEGMVARELYGAEALPRWWCLAKSIECARILLKSLQDTVEEWVASEQQSHESSNPSSGRFRGVVVLDRYLPPKPKMDGQGKINHLGKGEPWDEESGRRSLVDALIDGPFEVVLVTSYVRERSRRGDSSHPRSRSGWRQRNSGELLRARRRLAERSPWLLDYGPSPDAPITKTSKASIDTSPYPDSPDLNAARERAIKWKPSIERIVKAARWSSKDCPIVLMTGWEAAKRASEVAPGLPNIEEVLEAAIRFHEINHRKRVLESEPKRARMGLICCCEPKRPTSPRETSNTLDQLLERFESTHSIGSILHESALYDFLKRDSTNMEKRRNREAFSEAVRFTFLECDRGFPYHYWLLAQIPWAVVATTNFDGFHERAYHAVCAESAEPEEKKLRLSRSMSGSGKDLLDHGSPEWEKLQSKVIKLRGHLREPENLLRTIEERGVENRVWSLIEELLKKPRREGQRPLLVVLGDPVQNNPKPKSSLDALDVVWVSMEASRPPAGSHDGWSLFVTNTHNEGTFLQASPYEFCFDLWRAFAVVEPEDARISRDGEAAEGCKAIWSALEKENEPLIESTQYGDVIRRDHLELLVDGRPCACCRLTLHSDKEGRTTTVMDKFGVLPEVRRRGLAHRLIQYAMNRYLSLADLGLGMDPVSIEVAAPPRGKPLLKRLGFKEAEEMPMRPEWKWFRYGLSGSAIPRMVERPQAFLSYKRDDPGPIDFIELELASLGFSVWRDVEALAPGDILSKRIRDAVFQSELFMAIVTPTYDQSLWGALERAFSEHGDVLIVFVSAGGQIPKIGWSSERLRLDAHPSGALRAGLRKIKQRVQEKKL